MGKQWLEQLRLRHVNLALALVLSLVAAVSIAVLAAWVLSLHLMVNQDTVSPAELTRIALTIAAGVGGVVALVVAYRRQRDAEKGRFLESFGAAAKQLGDSDVAVRLAGVYAMAGVADQTARGHRQQCIDVLCAYLRLPYSPELGSNHQTALALTKPIRRKPGTEELTFNYRQNDREVRQTIVRVMEAHLQKDALVSWSNNSFDLTGSHLEALNFTDAVFSGTITSFRDATISGDSSFVGATFNGGLVSFHGATFSGASADFGFATFSGDSASFDGATFEGASTSFEGAEFSAIATAFRGATFGGGSVSFGRARFSGDAIYFERALFSGDTSFEGAWFRSNSTSFKCSTFSGAGTSFAGADFGDGTVSFTDPVRWDPPPVFDWNDAGVLKPPNVQPQVWPPSIGQP